MIKKVIIFLSAIWNLFIFTVYFFGASQWIFNILSFFPPFLYFFISLFNFIIIFFLLLDPPKIIKKQDLDKSINARDFIKNHVSKITLLIISFLSIYIAVPISDLNLNFLSSNNFPEGQYKLLSWNTLYWEEDPSTLFEIVKAENPDVIHFQEYIIKENFPDFFIKRDPNQIELIKKAFPEYTIAHEGELITLSKFPIKEIKRFENATFLRVDVEIEDTIVSFYNAHIPVHIDLKLLSEPADFIMDMKSRDEIRKREFNILINDIQSNPNKKIISGDFNTTKQMGDMENLFELTEDAIKRSNLFIPTTWSAKKTFNFWRIDYVLHTFSSDLKTYNHIFHHDVSDHAMMKVTFQIKK